MLLIDANPARVRPAAAALARAGFTVRTALSGAEAFGALGHQPPDVVLLDLSLPQALDVCSDLRRWWSIPIIALSDGGDEMEQVRALDAGTDDCLVKPYKLPELAARIRVALRHSVGGTSGAEIAFDDGALRVDLGSRRAWRAGTLVALTPREFDLLKFLIQRRDRLLPASEILAGVWGSRHERQRRYLRHYISRLRAKIGAGCHPARAHSGRDGWHLLFPLLN